MITPEKDQLLQAIVSSSDDAILSKTLDGIITTWNAAAEKMFGYTAEEAVGMNVRQLLPDPDIPFEIDDILARVSRGERIGQHVTERKTKDGRKIKVSLSISPIYDHNREIVGASDIAHELTEPEQRLQELRALVMASTGRAGAVEGLAKVVRDQGKAIDALDRSVSAFVPGSELETKLSALQHKLTFRSVIMGVAVTVLSLMMVLGSYSFVQSQQRQRNIDTCYRRKDTYQLLRDIVDRSQSGDNLDKSKLSPASLQILDEFAKAQRPSDPVRGYQNFHDYVWAKTPIPDCTKLPKP